MGKVQSHRPISLSEPLKPLVRMIELLLWQLLLIHLDGDIPHLFMLFIQQDHGAGGLGVEGARAMEDGMFDDLLDACVRDGRGGVEGVVSAAVLDGVKERFGGRHSCRDGLTRRRELI